MGTQNELAVQMYDPMTRCFERVNQCFGEPIITVLRGIPAQILSGSPFSTKFPWIFLLLFEHVDGWVLVLHQVELGVRTVLVVSTVMALRDPCWQVLSKLQRLGACITRGNLTQDT